MKKLILSLLVVTLVFLAPDWAKAARFESIPGAITDNATGLMWLSRPCCIHGYWEQSSSYTAGLDHAGYQDWRSPTIEELNILILAIGNPSNFPTQINYPPFTDMQQYYWTTTDCTVFDISNSTVFYDNKNPYWIWPVRTAFIPKTEPEFPDDIQAPTGAVHAHGNVLWSPNNKMVTVTLEGYVRDELSMARDGEGIGVSEAYLVIDDTQAIILRNGTTDLLDSNGKFVVNIQIKAVKDSVYEIELYASDTESTDNGGQNTGLVDSTYIRVPHDMSDGKSSK